MKVRELIESREFSFNAPFRVVVYAPTEKDVDHLDILYTSESEGDCPFDVGNMHISAINENDGVIEIECY